MGLLGGAGAIETEANWIDPMLSEDFQGISLNFYALLASVTSSPSLSILKLVRHRSGLEGWRLLKMELEPTSSGASSTARRSTSASTPRRPAMRSAVEWSRLLWCSSCTTSRRV